MNRNLCFQITRRYKDCDQSNRLYECVQEFLAKNNRLCRPGVNSTCMLYDFMALTKELFDLKAKGYDTFRRKTGCQQNCLKRYQRICFTLKVIVMLNKQLSCMQDIQPGCQWHH